MLAFFFCLDPSNATTYTNMADDSCTAASSQGKNTPSDDATATTATAMTVQKTLGEPLSFLLVSSTTPPTTAATAAAAKLARSGRCHPFFNHQFLSKEDHDQLAAFCDGCDFSRLYLVRGHNLGRAPKLEFFRDERVVYRWGQQTICYDWGTPMPPLLCKITDMLTAATGGMERPNHCIIIKMSDHVKHFAPMHHDKQDFGDDCDDDDVDDGDDESSNSDTTLMKKRKKQKPAAAAAGARDIAQGTSIFDISLGTPRTFCIHDVDDGEAVVVWSRALESGSLLTIDSNTNRLFKHSVPPARELVGRPPRYSVIFRTVKTLYDDLKKNLKETGRDEHNAKKRLCRLTDA
jgi:hypothetical protein